MDQATHAIPQGARRCGDSEPHVQRAGAQRHDSAQTTTERNTCRGGCRQVLGIGVAIAGNHLLPTSTQARARTEGHSV